MAALPHSISVGRAAEKFEVSAGTVRNWIAKGYLRAVRLPSGHRRIPESEVTRLLTQMFHMPEPTEETVERRVRVGPMTPDDWGP